jgi:hypothetical protein
MREASLAARGESQVLKGHDFSRAGSGQFRFRFYMLQKNPLLPTPSTKTLKEWETRQLISQLHLA